MNKEITLCELLKIVEPFALYKKLEKSFSGFEGIAESLQSSSRKDIVFYRLNKGEQAWVRFLDRYRNSDYGLLVLCGNPPSLDVIERCVVVKEESFTLCQSLLLDKLYPFDSKRVKLVGITGTNGKTTTAHLSLKIAELLGKKA